MTNTSYMTIQEAQARTLAARKVLRELLLREARAEIHNQIQLACDSGEYRTLVGGDAVAQGLGILEREIEAAGYIAWCDKGSIFVSWDPEHCEPDDPDTKKTGKYLLEAVQEIRLACMATDEQGGDIMHFGVHSAEGVYPPKSQSLVIVLESPALTSKLISKLADMGYQVSHDTTGAKPQPTLSVSWAEPATIRDDKLLSDAIKGIRVACGLSDSHGQDSLYLKADAERFTVLSGAEIIPHTSEALATILDSQDLTQKLVLQLRRVGYQVHFKQGSERILLISWAD